MAKTIKAITMIQRTYVLSELRKMQHISGRDVMNILRDLRDEAERGEISKHADIAKLVLERMRELEAAYDASGGIDA